MILQSQPIAAQRVNNSSARNFKSILLNFMSFVYYKTEYPGFLQTTLRLSLTECPKRLYHTGKYTYYATWTKLLGQSVPRAEMRWKAAVVMSLLADCCQHPHRPSRPTNSMLDNTICIRREKKRGTTQTLDRSRRWGHKP